MRFQVASRFHRGNKVVREESPIFSEVGPAMNYANAEVSKGAKSAFVLRDSEGADHPDNKGKFFLHLIIKG